MTDEERDQAARKMLREFDFSAVEDHLWLLGYDDVSIADVEMIHAKVTGDG